MKWVIGLIIAAVYVSLIDAHLAQDLPPNLAIPIPNPTPIRRPLKYNKFLSRRQGTFKTACRLPEYFWWDLCEIQGTTRGSCRSGFFDLVIKDTRKNLTGDLNLVGLPWDRIAADLRAIRGLTFDNPAVTYIWIGPGMG
ncbi:hypothetical protein DPMN_057580 [Dreissena polymorpha]|uniref:Uncharacterized protein n=1 Tax=Dreissena polymorpha TaxID=45954 RepID=A0A9D4C080_DREPO|nr:hypothetical protein DPMN_057580 [Dreissena polymorpha]